MKSALSLMLIACLAGSAAPVAAQQPFPPLTAGPITRSIAREAARVAAAPPTEAADTDWSRVRKLPPGTAIIVGLEDASRANRYFVAADETDLTVLNVTVDLPSAARNVLRDVASRHADYFRAAQRGDTFHLDQRVSLGPDGVFVADQKVAELAQVVEEYGRLDIAGITIAGTTSNPVGCALAAYYGGAVVGALPGALIGGAAGRDTGPALLGMMVGWSIGSVHVYRKCRHKPEIDLYPSR